MQKLQLLILLLLYATHSFSQNTQLSEQANIFVITLGPTQEAVYSAFGHSAVRIHDPEKGIDHAYNYGIFDFDQPNFYLNFAKGHLKYKLGVSEYPYFKDYYIYHNRFVHEQALNLSQDQKQKLFDYLQWNALPENQYYFYDYFYNNCSTKIRDVIATALGDEVYFDGSYIKTKYTIRELTDIYLTKQPWGDLGIDVGLGLPMDKKASPYEYMFLPDYLESGLNHATIKQQGGVYPLVKTHMKIYESHDEDLSWWPPHPMLVFSVIALLALALSFQDFKKRKSSTWFDAILFGACGFVGLLLLLLWTATDHRAAANNLNILWALPTHLLVVIALPWQSNLLKKYFLVSTIISVALLLSWPVFPQKLNYSLIPLVFTLMARSFTQYRLRKPESL